MLKKIFSILFFTILLTQVLPVKLIAGYMIYGKNFSVEKHIESPQTNNQQTLEEEIKPIKIFNKQMDQFFIDYNLFVPKQEYFLFNAKLIPPPLLDKDCQPPNSI